MSEPRPASASEALERARQAQERSQRGRWRTLPRPLLDEAGRADLAGERGWYAPDEEAFLVELLERGKAEGRFREALAEVVVFHELKVELDARTALFD